ncbi:MAG TPA: hypothetical protein VGJ44_02845 [Kribbellaceae bacterium]
MPARGYVDRVTRRGWDPHDDPATGVPTGNQLPSATLVTGVVCRNPCGLGVCA